MKKKKELIDPGNSVTDRLLRMVQDQYNSAPPSANESDREDENSKRKTNKNESINGKTENPLDKKEIKMKDTVKQEKVNTRLFDMVKEQYGDSVPGTNDNGENANDAEKSASLSPKAKKKRKKEKKKAEKKLKKKKKKEKKDQKNKERAKKSDKVIEAKRMKPMTKEEWEANKSEVSTNLDSDGKPKSSIYYQENKQKHEDAYKWVLSGEQPPPHVRAAYKTFKRPQSQWSH